MDVLAIMCDENYTQSYRVIGKAKSKGREAKSDRRGGGRNKF